MKDWTGLAIAAALLAFAPQVARAATPVPAAIRDCADCPDMLPIPQGSFTMGTRPGGYEQAENTGETPPAAIAVPAAFLMSQTEVTVAQFAAFVSAARYRPAARCRAYLDGRWTTTSKADWRTAPDGDAMAGGLPATCVTWSDAQAYALWLSAKTGQHYRLPSEAEWEYAARGGIDAPRYWGWNSFEGVSISDACDNANTYDVTAMRVFAFGWPHAQCADGFTGLAPAATFRPNAFGLYDMIGNAWEWTQDCYTASYANRAKDSRPWLWSGGCEERPVRGGSWASRPLQARAANRGHREPSFAGNDLGFRVARDDAAPRP